jgi:hypothetical protein
MAPILTHEVAPEIEGNRLTRVHVVLENGAEQVVDQAVIEGGTLSGKTGGQDASIPVSNIRYAWRNEDEPRTAVFLGYWLGLHVAGGLALVIAFLASPNRGGS